MHPSIPGLYYIPNALKIDIIKTIDDDSISWKPLSDSKNSRKVKQYGYLYNYKNTTAKDKTHPLPDYLQPYHDTLKQYMNEFGLDDLDMNQCIMNNYYKTQCISKHIDSKHFGSVIGCYTLGSSGIMRFTCDNDTVDIVVEPNSLYIMSGDARYKWSHEMLRLKHDRRISITFRNV
jgi:alkylated DNA repair dioxygenase AlkB